MPDTADDTVRFPIVYVRGFAGGQDAINSAADDAFYGFNDGATHIRIADDGSGSGGKDALGTPQFFQFEGPMVRLMQDEDYQVIVHGDQHAYLTNSDGGLPATSIWVYRFYDDAADTFEWTAEPFSLAGAADKLLDFVQLVLRKTAPRDDDQPQKVWLVAHSMGGLICRSMLQRTCIERGVTATDIVDKLFTYATPHGGIEFRPGGGPITITVPGWAPFGADVFNTDVMYDYLTPTGIPRPHDWTPQRIFPADAFPANRVYCVVGTNPHDYGVAKYAVGPQSDGLVQIRNAYVEDAPRAYIHRSHSGRYGEVNSEEGYQNLRRFIVGALKVEVEMIGASVPPPDENSEQTWQLDATISIRGLPVPMTSRISDHHCPIVLTTTGAGADGRLPVLDTPLATTFVLDPRHFKAARRPGLPDEQQLPRARYVLSLRALRHEIRNRFLRRDDETLTAEFADDLVVDVGTPEPGTQDDDEGQYVWARWNSEIGEVLASIDPVSAQAQHAIGHLDLNQAAVIDIDFPKSPSARILGTPTIRLTITGWR